MHTCHGAPVGSNAIAHYAGGKWAIVCEHGDDVLSAEMAAKRCPGLTLGEAIDIGMPPENIESFDSSDPIQAVGKYYALWEKREFQEMYAMLSASYRASHPYASWLAGHVSTKDIRAESSPGVASDRVNVMIYSSDISTPQSVKRYAGTWVLVRSNGVWKLDSVTLKPLSS
jgi:hypothetical protein